MKEKTSGYVCGCYFDGKLIEKCDIDDSEVFLSLMQQYGNDASSVLTNCNFLSQKLRGIFEKVMVHQYAEQLAVDASRLNGEGLSQDIMNKGRQLFTEPKASPWGETHQCTTLLPGVFVVDTASHGGVMIDKELATLILSADARKCAFTYEGYLCYEEDCDAAVVLLELMTERFIQEPKRYSREDYIMHLEGCVRTYNAEYIKSREANKK